MSNESIELINYLKRYGLNNEIFRKLHPSGISIYEFQQLCLSTEYFEHGSDEEITKLRLVFLRVTIRTDKYSSSIMEDEFVALTEAAIRGFPSAQNKQYTGAGSGNGGFLQCSGSIH